MTSITATIGGSASTLCFFFSVCVCVFRGNQLQLLPGCVAANRKLIGFGTLGLKMKTLSVGGEVDASVTHVVVSLTDAEACLGGLVLLGGVRSVEVLGGVAPTPL